MTKRKERVWNPKNKNDHVVNGQPLIELNKKIVAAHGGFIINVFENFDLATQNPGIIFILGGASLLKWLQYSV